MKKDYILFIDSGIGGLSTLAQSAKLFKFNYIFYADNSHSPYGNHTKNEIFGYLDALIANMLEKFSIKIIVLACNTATASAIDALRLKYKQIVFIGTEPAIMLAKKYNFNSILSLTTPLTKELERYKNLCRKSGKDIKTISIATLVKTIESYMFFPTQKNRYKILKVCAEILNKSKCYDCIVLGCTHYVFLRPFFRQLSSQTLVDGNFGVAKNLIKKTRLLNIKNQPNLKLKIILSLKKRELSKKYKKIFYQTLAKLQ